MSKRIITPYEKIRSSLHTLDVIVCEQRNIIMWLIGHTAGVYVCPLTGQVQVLESTSVSRLTGVKGVQLNPMGAWLEKYPGHVGIRRFHLLSVNEQDRIAQRYAIQERTEMFIRKHRGTSYPNIKTRKGRWYLIRAAWDGKFLKKASTNIETNAWIFCTDLLGRWFRFCAAIPATVNCAELEPDDMYPGESFDELLETAEFSENMIGGELGEIIWIK